MQLLINDRIAPVDLEPGERICLRWRDDEPFDETRGGIVAYEVAVAERACQARQGAATVWGSGWVAGDGFEGVCLHVPDEPSRRYWVSVRFRSEFVVVSPWAEPMTFGTGAGPHWQVTPIWTGQDATDLQPDGAEKPNLNDGWALLHGVVDIPSTPVRWATLNVTASSTKPTRQFVYRMWVNGRFAGLGPVPPVADEARYDGFDVTGLLKAGSNRLDAMAYTLADQRFAAQLDVCLEDGRMVHWGTGADWTASLRRLADDEEASVGTQYFVAPAEHVLASRYRCDLPGEFRDADSWPRAEVKQPFARCCATPYSKVELRAIAPKGMNVLAANRVVLDFGESWVGGIAVTMRTGINADITVRCAETLNADGSAKYHLGTGNTYEDRFVFGPDGGEVESSDRDGGGAVDGGGWSPNQRCETWGIRVFRYVELVCDDLNGNVSSDLAALLDDGSCTLEARALVYPLLAQVATFHSGSPVLDAVWRLCAHTIEACTGNMYVDSWTRERAPYEADAWIEQHAHLVLDNAPAIGRYGIDYLIANRTWPTEWPLYLILAVHESWWITGDDTQVRTQYARLKSLLPERYIDKSSGLVVKDPGRSSHTDGDLVDWPEVERDGFVFGRVNTVVNALASQAYEDMAAMAQHLVGRLDDGVDDTVGGTAGDAVDAELTVGSDGAHEDMAGSTGHASSALRGDAERFAARAATMRQAIHIKLYDPDRHAYVDGLKDGPDGSRIGHCSLHASAFALAFARVPESRVGDVADFLHARGMACSVYAAAVYLDGLFRAGRGRDADMLLGAEYGVRTWSHMIEQGAGATMEAWDVTLKPNTTYSHPWAASPLYLLAEGTVGIRPLEPGYRRFAVVPQMGECGEVHLDMPVRTGRISVRCRRACHTGAGIDAGAETAVLEVDVPDRTAATVVLPAPCDGASPARVGFEADAVARDVRRIEIDGASHLTPVATEPFDVAGVQCPAGAVRIDCLQPGHHRIRMGV